MSPMPLTSFPTCTSGFLVEGYPGGWFEELCWTHGKDSNQDFSHEVQCQRCCCNVWPKVKLLLMEVSAATYLDCGCRSHVETCCSMTSIHQYSSQYNLDLKKVCLENCMDHPILNLNRCSFNCHILDPPEWHCATSIQVSRIVGSRVGSCFALAWDVGVQVVFLAKLSSCLQRFFQTSVVNRFWI